MKTATMDYAECPASRSATVMQRWARKLVFKLMRNLHTGRIVLKEEERRFCFGKTTSPQAELTVCSPAFYPKVLFGGSVGAGEAYVDGLWHVDDLTALIRIMVANMKILDNMEKGFARLLSPLRLFSHLRKANSKRRARKNISAHYDLSNEMYSSFLDETMMYSSAIYPDERSTLEQASRHKLDLICRKLGLHENDHILEIGTGWGGFALHAAANYGCRVTTTTISEAQHREARKRIEAAGLGDRITLLQKDYRDLTGEYDKLVSIEMIEAVGHRYLPLFFEKCASLLKADGLLLLQAITIADQKYAQYIRSVDFIQRHVFPGGSLLSNRVMFDLMARKTDLVVRSLDDFGLHYARTLADWRSRFSASFHELKQHGFDERFKRLWEFYLCYCEGGFRERSISVVQLLASKPGWRSVS